LRLIAIGEVIENREGNAKILIYPRFARGLRGLDEYSHCIILYYLHKVVLDIEKFIAEIDKIRPMHAPLGASYGVFATRSPHRPNQIGMTVVRIKKIDENILHVEGFDGYVGSPILDIKPYTTRDIVLNASFPQWFPRRDYEEEAILLVHNRMNSIWNMGKKVRELLVEHGYNVSAVSYSHNNYVSIKNTYYRQEYPLPCLTITNLCEIIIQLDCIYATFAVRRDSIDKNFLKSMINTFGLDLEIFGGEDYLHTFYPKDELTSIDDVFMDIIRSGEKIIQLSIKIKFENYHHIIDVLEKITTIIGKYGTVIPP